MEPNNNIAPVSTPLEKARQIYANLYRNYREVLRLNSAAVLDAARDEAFGCFERQGFPTRQDESYRHCDLSEALSVDYGMNLYRLGIPAHPSDVFRCDVPSLSTRLYFIVNDLYYPNKKLVPLPDGVLCGSLNTLLQEHPEIGGYYNRLCAQGCYDAKGKKYVRDSYAAMNTAFAQDGLLLYIPKGVRLDKPLQLVQMFHGEIDILATRRLLIILEDNASANLMVCDHAITGGKYFSNQVAEIYLGQGSHLEYYEIEMTHDNTARVANTFASLASDSSFVMNYIGLENGLTRNNVYLKMDGRGAEAELSGLNLLSRKQQADQHILVDHTVSGGSSNQLYKYVLDGASTGVFGGKVLIRENAQQTSAYQSNANLCLGDDSRMHSQPQLEIYADDVKCSHGSATGQMDENALFYMRQRGLDEEEAKRLLKFAFTADVVDRIPFKPLQDRVRMLIGKRFKGELSKCHECKICP